MANSPTSVITPERAASGKTFQEYLDSGINNRELFEMNYNGLLVTDAQKARLQALKTSKGLDHMVVIGEDWCPDVYRGLGVAQRIAEAAGIPMKMFERDQNKDMIAEYLKDGQFESIPVYVFYDKNHTELGHFIERPKLANEQIHVTREVMGGMSAEAIAARLGHEPSEEEIASERAASRARYMEWQKTSPVWAGWRVAAVDEVIELLEGTAS